MLKLRTLIAIALLTGAVACTQREQIEGEGNRGWELVRPQAILIEAGSPPARLYRRDGWGRILVDDFVSDVRTYEGDCIVWGSTNHFGTYAACGSKKPVRLVDPTPRRNHLSGYWSRRDDGVRCLGDLEVHDGVPVQRVESIEMSTIRPIAEAQPALTQEWAQDRDPHEVVPSRTEWLPVKADDYENEESADDTYLLLAIAQGDAQVVHRMLEDGADVDRPSRNGSLPLVEACRSGRESIACALLAAGADPDHPDANGNRAWDVVNSPGVANCLLDNIGPITKEQAGLLLEAARKGHWNGVRERILKTEWAEQ